MTIIFMSTEYVLWSYVHTICVQTTMTLYTCLFCLLYIYIYTNQLNKTPPSLNKDWIYPLFYYIRDDLRAHIMSESVILTFLRMIKISQYNCLILKSYTNHVNIYWINIVIVNLSINLASMLFDILCLCVDR